MINRTEALCKALGWQGGTIHQVAETTGCLVGNLLYATPKDTSLLSAYSGGWFSGRTCTLAFNQSTNFPKHHGNLEFWLGVAEGLQHD